MSEVLAEYDALAARVLAALRPDLSEPEFNALAFEMHAFQRRWNEPYARFCATRPAPTNWREIPATPQSAFKRFTLSCVPREHIGKTLLTSGTTGETRGAHHFRDTALYEAALLAGWRRLGLARMPHFILTPPAHQWSHSSLAHMLQTLESLSVESFWFVDATGALRADFAKALESVERSSSPVILLGPALAFLNVFERLGSRSFHLPNGSLAMETGGYKGSGRDIVKAELYAMFERHLGLKPDAVLNEYGMTELSSQFYTRGLGAPHTGGPWVRALVIDPASGAEVENGEVGVLQIFDLANLNSSLAIETQDLAIRREEGFELLGRDPAALPRGCSRAADEMLRR